MLRLSLWPFLAATTQPTSSSIFNLKSRGPASGSPQSRALASGRWLGWGAAVGLGLGPLASLAASTGAPLALDAITVTAEKRKAEVMEVSGSVSARSGEELADAEVESLEELAQQVPNLHVFTWGGSRESNIFIRGIGPGLFTDQTVGFYVDGVNYTSNGMFDIELMDIERVEVLRGPQGTLYGGNSLGGIINIITRAPGNTPEGRVSLSADNLDRRKVGLQGSLPLIRDELFASVSLSATDDDGHLTNIHNGEDYGATREASARVKVHWQPSHDLEADLSLDYDRRRGDSYGLGTAEFIEQNPDKVDHNMHGEDEQDAKGISMSITRRFDAGTLTSITGWRDWETLNSADQDAGSNPDYTHHSTSDESQNQLSQELRWASGGEANLSWLAGLYAYRSEYQVDGVNVLDYTAFGMGGPYRDLTDASKDNSGQAVFGQLDYRMGEHLSFTAGLRLDREKREADIRTQMESGNSVHIQGDKTFKQWLPKLGASWALREGLVYGSVSRGYRAGGFDYLYPSEDDPTYDSETSTNYELGYKSNFLSGALELSTALFYIEIDDQQVQQLVPQTGEILTDNAGKGRSQGLEFESRYRPAPGWLVSASGSYTDAEYVRYQGCDFSGMSANCNGNKMVNTPELTGNFAVQHRRSLTDRMDLFVRTDVQYIGDYYFDSQNQFKQNAYSLLNFKVGVELEDWEVYAWVKNAADTYYSRVEFDFGAGRTLEAGDPRRFGVSLAARF